MFLEPHVAVVGILIEVIDSIGVEGRGPAFDPVNAITLAQKEFRKIGTILSGDACNQSRPSQIDLRARINDVPGNTSPPLLRVAEPRGDQYSCTWRDQAPHTAFRRSLDICNSLRIGSAIH